MFRKLVETFIGKRGFVKYLENGGDIVMATMMDKRPNAYKGEQLTWELLHKNLPDEVVVYNHREVNGREFDFCLMIKDMGIFIVEVKGWNKNIKVIGVDEIHLLDTNEIVASPKKQANGYRFAFLNIVKKKFNMSPLILDLVCYPFLSEKDYKNLRLDIVSEPQCTLFAEDIENTARLGRKLNELFNCFKVRPHTELDSYLFSSMRQYFEPMHVEDRNEIKKGRDVYSILKTYKLSICDEDIERYVDYYLYGTKIILFVSSSEDILKIYKQFAKRLVANNIKIEKNNLVLNNNEEELKIPNTDNGFRVFNFEVYRCENIENECEIIEGIMTDDIYVNVSKIAKECDFNFEQYCVEHADTLKNILVKAGAGTGKTYSMVSRIAYLCNKQMDPVVSLEDSIAMVTFTNDAADNMKSRLKQMFINYFVLTRKPRYLQFIEDIEHMQIATIHKFAKKIIQDSTMELGLGNDFKISSSDYAKEQIYNKYLNEFIDRKTEDNTDFYKDLKMPIYKLKKLLISFSKNLYNKSVDIKSINVTELGKSIDEIPYFNQLIEDVVMKAELEYASKIKQLNKVDLKECMILLGKVVEDSSRKKYNLKYEYLFIDEFQDTDDVQIDAFLGLQKIIGYKLFVVGDLKQSIYRFRGATIGAFDRLNIDKSWKEYSLSINYRTESRLLLLYDKIFTKMGQQQYLPFSTTDSLISRIDTEIPEEELIKKVEYHSGNEEEFYNALFNEIELQKKNIEKTSEMKLMSAKEKIIAILVRENWQIRNIIKEAKNRGIAVETQVGGDLYQLASAIDFYKLLLALNNSREPLYLFNFIASNYSDIYFDAKEMHGRTKVDIRKNLVSVLDNLFEDKMGVNWTTIITMVHDKPILQVLKNIYVACKPWEQYSNDVDEQKFYKANYELVIEKMVKTYSTDYLTLNVICDSMKINIVTKQEELARSVCHEDIRCKLICSTIHKSKGLEYGTVILPYTNQRIDSFKKAEIDVVYVEGKLGYAIRIGKNKKPSQYYDVNEEVEQRVMEESRVLYVAMTRAIRNLIWLEDLDEKNGVSWRKILED